MTTKKDQDMYPIVRVLGGKSQAQLAKENLVFEQQELKQKERAIKDGLARAQQVQNETTGILGFARAIKYRNNQPHGLDQYRAMQKENLQKLYVELIDLTRRRGLPLASEDTDFARLFLENLLSLR